MRPGPASQGHPTRKHPEPTGVTARIPEPRTGPPNSVPAWPAGLIEPSSEELVRWRDLWDSPQAAGWTAAESGRMVADVVRLEVRCRQRLPSADDYVAQLDQLRRVLGLTLSPE